MLKRILLVVLLAFAGLAQAAVYSLPWGPKPQFVDANGAPMSSGTFLTFAGGSSTPQVTYTDQTGGVANPTTITLNTRGETPNEVWLTGGQTYKFVLKDSAGSTVWTVDSVSGVNDVTSALSEWIAGPAPTFVSATSFTLAGDQTVEFHKGRRLKTTNSGGTIYSTIVSSVFGASTTVTVANDSGVIDGGLSAVSYGIVRAANPSISPDMVARKGTAVVSAATTDIWSIAGDFVHITGATGPITSFGTAPYAGAQRTLIFDSTPTITHSSTSLQLPGQQSITVAVGARMIVRADTTANMIVVDYVPAGGIAVPRSYLSGLTMSSAGGSATMTVAAGQAADSTNAVAMTLASLIGKTTAAWAVGSGNGGLDTGAIANSTWYHFYEIMRSDTGVVDVLFSLSASAPTMPASYTFKRRIGSGKTDGAAQWTAFSQKGDEFLWKATVKDLATGTLGAAAALQTMTVPTGVQVNALFATGFWNALVGATLYISSPDQNDEAASNVSGRMSLQNDTAGRWAAAHFNVRTNTSAQIRVIADTANSELDGATYGWIDRRGRDD